MRGACEELAALLGPEEASAAVMDALFAPFMSVQPLQVSAFTTAAWQQAAQDHERLLVPLEQRACQRLQELFGET